MQGRLWLNLLLLILVAGLGTAAYFRHQKNSAPKPKLLELKAEAITSAEVAWLGAPKIVLKKTGSDWAMTEPVAARVDPFEILGVTNLAATEVQETVGRDGLVLKDIGLDPPERVVTLNGTRIAFGGTEALNYRRYVKIGEKILLIDDPASPALDKEHHDLVSKQLLGPKDEIAAIALPTGEVIQQAAAGQWQAAGSTADAKAMAALAKSWKDAKALYTELAEVPSEGERVKISLKDGRALEFVIAARDPQLSLYSQAQGVRFVLSRELVDPLLTLAAAKPEAAAPAAQPAAPALPPAPAATTLGTPAELPSLSEGLSLPEPAAQAP